MRVFYVDAGLTGDVGHHAYHCRYIAGELRARAIDTQVFALAGLAPALPGPNSEAIRDFPQRHIGREADYDPISGWLNDFDTAAVSFEEDLWRLPQPEAVDLLFLSALSPAQLLAVVRWHDALPAGRRPAVVLELVTSDLELARTPSGAEGHDPRPREEEIAARSAVSLRRQAPRRGRLLEVPFHRLHQDLRRAVRDAARDSR